MENKDKIQIDQDNNYQKLSELIVYLMNKHINTFKVPEFIIQGKIEHYIQDKISKKQFVNQLANDPKRKVSIFDDSLEEEKINANQFISDVILKQKRDSLSNLDSIIENTISASQEEEFFNDFSKSIVALKYKTSFVQKKNSSNSKSIRRGSQSIIDFQLDKKRSSNRFSLLSPQKSEAIEESFFLKDMSQTLEIKMDTNHMELFQELVVLGNDKQTLQECIRNNQGLKKQKVKPSILYCYPSKSDQLAAKRILPEFAFPFGITANKIPLSKSRINQIIYPNNPSELKQKFFVFTFKGEDSYTKFQSDENFALLEKYNPNKILYCMCMQTRDFLCINSGENNEKIQVWKNQKVFCIITLFPFVSLFQMILLELVSLTINQIV